MNIQIYADGASSRKYKAGAWAYCILEEGRLINSAANAVRDATNNQMEMQAVISGLLRAVEMRHDDKKITVFSDSQYVIRGVTLWAPNWKKVGWRRRTHSGKWVQISNLELWKLLDRLQGTFLKPVTFKWVRGHAGDTWNEKCDKLATETLAEFVMEGD